MEDTYLCTVIKKLKRLHFPVIRIQELLSQVAGFNWTPQAHCCSSDNRPRADRSTQIADSECLSLGLL